MAVTRQFKPSQLKPGLLYEITASSAVYATSASMLITGSIVAKVSTTNNLFLISSGSKNLLAITQSGVVVLSTQSIQLTNPAPNGGIYFTSSSFFVGLD